MDAPLNDLVRAVLDPSRAQVDDGRTMTGYPVVFDTWTTIDSWEGRFKERIAPTALNRTLKNNRDKIKVLFNHGMDPSIGDKPLGRASVMRTDDTGLYVEVPLSDTSYNDDLRALMADGAIDGMSFRFSVVNEEWNEPKGKTPERTITELKLHEFGPVTFPAYEATQVGMRSREDFSAWRGLTDEKREAIREIVYEDTRTPEILLAEGHEDDEARDESPDDPASRHSEGLTRDARDRVLYLIRSGIK